ncbi:GGDEF domain-containing protein [Roseibium sp.]|uniref:GGDEF domain-containing protein n=1 Tax=Roseibium sp. TaxID=1936156 RepID=UPI003B521F66
MLDAKTILFSLVVAELTASAVLCFLFFFWKHRDSAGNVSVGLWSVAFLLGAIGTCLLSLRGTLPDAITLLLANFLILFGTGIRRSGVAAFFQKPKLFWVAGLAGAVWLGLCQIPEFRQSLSYRVSYNQSVMILFILWTAIICLRSNTEKLVTPKIYAFSAGLEASAHVSLMICLSLGASNEFLDAIKGYVVTIALLVILVSMVLCMFTSLSMPIERSLLQFKTKAYLDSLTGLPNRRAIFEHAEALKRRLTGADFLTVIRFDIDDFKLINDTFGHAMGDCVLRLFGSVCRDTQLANTIAGRLGGDEFAILCQGTGPKQAKNLVVQIKQRFADACLKATNGDAQVSLSAGISYVPIRRGIDEALEVADKATYEAKSRGRGQTVIIALPADKLPEKNDQQNFMQLHSGLA